MRMVTGSLLGDNRAYVCDIDVSIGELILLTDGRYEVPIVVTDVSSYDEGHNIGIRVATAPELLEESCATRRSSSPD